MGRALRPIPQEKITLVGWAEEPVLVIFARGLLQPAEYGKKPGFFGFDA